jgi:predicted negative regulator of RcsB-dependent stress response
MKYMPVTFKKLNQKGFESIAIIFVILILAIIGGTGYKIWSNSRSRSTAPTAAVASAAVVPAAITTKADLARTIKALDTSGTQVDSQVNGDSLNSDINDLL